MKALVLVRAITTSLTYTLVIEIVALQNKVLFRFTNPNMKYYHSKYFIKKKKKKKKHKTTILLVLSSNLFAVMYN